MNSVSLFEYIAKRLKEIGITTAFATSGQFTHHLLNYSQKELNLVTTHSAEEALLAANGFSKAKKIEGKTLTPGCAIISYGPSSFSSINSIISSFSEQVPLIIINGTPCLKDQYQWKLHEMLEKSWEMFNNITFRAIRVTPNGMVTKSIDETIELCLTEGKPVYIEIAEDLWKMKLNYGKEKLKIEDFISNKTYLKKAVDEIFENMKKSRNVLVWVGNEIQRKDSSKLVEEFLKKSELNWATSINGKSVLNEKETKNFVGVYCGKSSKKETYDAFKQAKFILGLGVTTFDVENLKVSIWDELPTKINYFWVMNNYVHGKCTVLSQVGIKDLLVELNKKLNEAQVIFKPYFKEIKFESKKYQLEDKLTYDGIVDKLVEKNYFDGKFITVDSTLGLFPLLTIPLKEKNCFFSQLTYGSFGYSLSASLGIWSVLKKKMCIFVGDGALQHMFKTVDTLIKIKSDVIIFVFSNGVMALNQWNQNPKGFKKEMYEHNILRKWHFSQLIKSMGGDGYDVENYDDFMKVLEKVEKKKGVVIINMVIPQNDYPELTKWHIEKS